ncbi:hypothetical protein K1T71_011260 [Dendrolimus kikuchii]|uniref:Uncharacterized protein n=1 Tax=Dendrolimus kikuchii TaxID=765133 RepID=A0ACC1CNB4_9NEOP|nr:hypothetical protein K1T71_011260 [Dendrolimus kikuchii]
MPKSKSCWAVLYINLLGVFRLRLCLYNIRKMMKFCLISVLAFAVSTTAMPKSWSCVSYPFPFYTKSEWGGREATGVTRLTTPVPFVVIHHTYIPGICLTVDRCMRDMRAMQDHHQLTNKWQDIGYSFAVGGEGSVFEGRGWQAVGAHAVGYNTNSIGIVLIGDFVSNLPPARQLETVKQLIQVGVDLGYIRSDYRLIGHRQATATECPGQALFTEISTWDHFDSTV